MSHFHISDEVSTGAAGGGHRVVVLVVSGEIDYEACPQLRERIFSHIMAGRRHLLLDLSMVSFIDSMAVGVLVASVARLRQAGNGALVVVCINDNERVLRIFDIAGVASVITLYRSREDALSALAAAWSVDASSWAIRDISNCAAISEPVRPAQPSGLGAVRKYAEEDAAARGARSDAGRCGAPSHKVDELA